MTTPLLPIWPYAYAGPAATGQIKAQAADFIVEEQLGFSPEGSGEHAFLYLEKTGENTEFVARLLARFAGVRQRDIGYAGLKDRHGITRQWFSVWLPGKTDPDWQGLAEHAQVKVLQVARHARKLKRGVLSGNRFQIQVRAWQGDNATAEQQLLAIKQRGFPNYFGEQRFGHQGRNLQSAEAVFAGKKVKPEQRSIYLSAVRSFLFNLCLAERVQAETWDTAMSGDVFNLHGSHSVFRAEQIDVSLQQRLASGDIHPAGVLYGKDAQLTPLEQQLLAAYPQMTAGLLQAGLEADYRALRVIPDDLSWQFNEQGLLLNFSLPAGAYATVLLRELVRIEE